MKTRYNLFAPAAFVLTAVLAACGGGGGSGGGTIPSGGGGPTPCPAGFAGTAPNCVPVVTTASVSGKLVDDNGNPVAAQPVAVASWAPSGSTYTAVASTDSGGNFSFTTAPGQYLLRIGADVQMTPAPGWTPYPTPGPPSFTPAPAGAIPVSAWQATVHDNVTLVAGTNALVAPTMPPQPGVTNPPVEASGKYRMSSLSAGEIECVYVANAYRVKAGLQPFVVDQWLLENSRNYNAAQIQNDLVLLSNGKPLSGRNAFQSNMAHCTYWMAHEATPGGAAYSTESDAAVVWMGARFGFDAHPGVNQSVSYGEWMRDPRTETSADSLYLGWP